MELCQTVVKKYLDTIVPNHVERDNNKATVELLDIIFKNNLLNNKTFTNYVGECIYRLYMRDSIVFAKYLKEYKVFIESQEAIILSHDFKRSIGSHMQGLHYFYKILHKNIGDEYIPSHFSRDTLFLLNLIPIFSNVMNLSNDELQYINNIIDILSTKNTIERQTKIYENKGLIIECIEKYLYHIAKICTTESKLKEYQKQSHVQIIDKWDKDDIELRKLTGFTTDEVYAKELLDNSDFKRYCFESGAVVINGGFPSVFMISNTVDEFMAKLKIKYPDIDRILHYMEFKPGVTITSFHED